LAKSIRLTGDTRPITLLTDKLDYSGLKIFDTVKLLKKTRGEKWKLNDDWQVYEQSPYDETFKIESDVIVTRSLDSWWSSCESRDLVVATGTRNFKQQQSTVRYYRSMLDENLLPDVYNGITYFKKSQLAKKFFGLVKTIFNNWQEINNSLTRASLLEHADTDTVYAIACKILGEENTTLRSQILQWVHMKSKINFTAEDWTEELVWELVGGDFRINTYSQLYPVHYHVKCLAQELEPLYDQRLVR
jgi:hypothetical protein